jgi:hypothetical protein
VRGRRRANIARKILVHEVNEETNLLDQMEVWFNSKREAFYDTFLSCCEKKKVKKCVKLWQIRLHVLLKMGLYATDTFSDLTIIVVIWQRFVLACPVTYYELIRCFHHFFTNFFH